MPNWVSNTLHARGSELQLNSLIETLGKPTPIYDYSTQSVAPISFWNIVSPPEEAIPIYKAAYIVGEIPEGITQEDWAKYNWYEWNIENWGCKWDARDAELEHVKFDDSIYFRFDTPWSPIVDLVVTLSKQFPEITFDYEYEEEQGWGGHLIVKDGTSSQEQTWDVPESHNDFDKHPWRDCECQSTSLSMFWYPDCPVTDTHDWVNEQWVKKN